MGKRGLPGVRLLAAAALLCAAGSVRAQSQPSSAGSDWSATAARTVPRDQTALQVEAGWPGIDLAFLRGLDSRSDIGLRVGFLYGFEGTSNSVAGLHVQVPYRRMIATGDFASFAFHIDPGFTLYGDNTARGGSTVGVGGPLGIIAGFQVDPRLTLDLAVDFPVLLSFTHPAGVFFGPEPGAGAEYLIDQNLAVTFRSRFGPLFSVANGYSTNQFAFTALLGLAYNTR